MNEYIERNRVVELIKDYGKGAISDGLKSLDPVDDIVMLAKAVDYIPAADVVSRSLFEQILFERDMALATLEEHGISLGQRKDKDND